jgi:NADH-quinone oxidoreductase subunit M
VLYRLYFEQHGTYSALVTDLYTLEVAEGAQMWFFAAFAVAFAIKVPMWPLHTWLPDAHVQAPTGGSVILAGVLLKMGAYGFLRFAMPLFPEAAVVYAPWIIGLSVVGIIYGALVAMVQDDIKKLVAYSSVSHMGFVMMGLFAMNAQGTAGGIYQMLSHGLSTGGLFLLVGVLYERRHTRLISEYGGIAKVMPAFAFVFMVVMLSSAGLPGLNGFVGEFLVLLGSFQHSPWMTAAAATGVVLGAVYLLWMYQRVMFGPQVNWKNRDLADLTRKELLVFAPLLVMIVVMGVYPGPFLEILEPSVERLLASVGQAPAATVVQVLGGHP